MTPEDISEMTKIVMDRVMEELGEDADHREIALAAMDMNEETVDAVMDYVSAAVNHQMFDHMVQNGGGMSPKELTELLLSICVPTLLLVARCYYKEPHKQEDQYMRTVAAELSLGTMIEEKRDLSEVWPAEYVTEITKVFSEPTQAFLAGVICGSTNG